MTNASLTSTNTGMKLNGRILLGSMCLHKQSVLLPNKLIDRF